jgi:hypothetical protein
MVARREETPAAPSSGERVATKLRRIAEKARKEPSFRFTSLYHLMNEEHLRGCFQRLRHNAAAGIDSVSKQTWRSWWRGCTAWRTDRSLSGASTYRNRAATNDAPWGYRA